MATATPAEIVTEAQEAGLAAGKAAFEKMGGKDGGWCGGYLLSVDRRTAVGKYLIESNLGYDLGKGIGVRDHVDAPKVQNMDLNTAMGEAMKAVFDKHGVRLAQARAYTD